MGRGRPPPPWRIKGDGSCFSDCERLASARSPSCKLIRPETFSERRHPSVGRHGDAGGAVGREPRTVRTASTSTRAECRVRSRSLPAIALSERQWRGYGLGQERPRPSTTRSGCTRDAVFWLHSGAVIPPSGSVPTSSLTRATTLPTRGDAGATLDRSLIRPVQAARPLARPRRKDP